MEILEKWLIMFNIMSKNNEVMGKILCHQVIGKYINTKIRWLGGEEINTKIHVICTDLSSSGKDQARKVVENISDKLGLKYQDYTESTDAGLVGSHHKKGGEYITKKGLFSEKDIISFSEAETLFNETEYNINTIKILQKATDHPGKVSKVLSTGIIDYNTETSILLLSTPFKAMKNLLLTQGLFQRCFYYKGDKTTNDILALSKEIRDEISKANGENTDNIYYNSKIKDFIDTLKDIARFAPPIMKFSDNIDEAFMVWDDFYKNKLKSLTEMQQETLATYKIRAEQMIFKLATHYAIFDKRDIANKEDFLKAIELVEIHIENISSLIHIFSGERSKETKLDNFQRENIISKFLQGNVMNKSELIDNLLLSEEWDLGFNKTFHFLNSLINNDKIEVSKEGRKMLLKNKVLEVE